MSWLKNVKSFFQSLSYFHPIQLFWRFVCFRFRMENAFNSFATDERMKFSFHFHMELLPARRYIWLMETLFISHLYYLMRFFCRRSDLAFGCLLLSPQTVMISLFKFISVIQLKAKFLHQTCIRTFLSSWWWRRYQQTTVLHDFETLIRVNHEILRTLIN